MRRVIVSLLVLSLAFGGTGFAGEGAAGAFPGQGGGADSFRPLHLRYLRGMGDGTLRLLFDAGDRGGAAADDEAQRSMRYFFTGMSLEPDVFWVNLKPGAQDEMIDPRLEMTDVGRVLLEADVQLKKDCAGLTSPRTPRGRQYWQLLRQKASELFANDDISMPTLARPWIVPDEIIVRQGPQDAYIYKATMKVMMEEDYIKDTTPRADRNGAGVALSAPPRADRNGAGVALSAPPRADRKMGRYEFGDERMRQLNAYAAQLMRELIVPQLVRDVNAAPRYAALRQVFYALILGQWYRRVEGKAGRQNAFPAAGLRSERPWSKERIFREYAASFTDGEYNIEAFGYARGKRVLRTYFSGGIALQQMQPQVIPAHTVSTVKPGYTIEAVCTTGPGGPALALLPQQASRGEKEAAALPPQERSDERDRFREKVQHYCGPDRTLDEMVYSARELVRSSGLGFQERSGVYEEVRRMIRPDSRKERRQLLALNYLAINDAVTVAKESFEEFGRKLQEIESRGEKAGVRPEAGKQKAFLETSLPTVLDVHSLNNTLASLMLIPHYLTDFETVDEETLGRYGASIRGLCVKLKSRCTGLSVFAFFSSPSEAQEFFEVFIPSIRKKIAALRQKPDFKEDDFYRKFAGYVKVADELRKEFFTEEVCAVFGDYCRTMRPLIESVERAADSTYAATESGQPPSLAAAAPQPAPAPVPASHGTNVPRDPGGIDLRFLEGAREMRRFPLRAAPVAEPLEGVSLTREWRMIQSLVEGGILPQPQRMQRYVRAAGKSGWREEEKEKVMLCIAQILRLQESRCCATERLYTELLETLET